jgi:hypothetical protein
MLVSLCDSPRPMALASTAPTLPHLWAVLFGEQKASSFLFCPPVIQDSHTPQPTGGGPQTRPPTLLANTHPTHTVHASLLLSAHLPSPRSDLPVRMSSSPPQQSSPLCSLSYGLGRLGPQIYTFFFFFWQY